MFRRVLLAMTLFQIGCAPVLTGPLDQARPEQASMTLDHGWALLQALLQDESSLSLILGIKNVDESVEVIVREISDTSARALRTLGPLMNSGVSTGTDDGLPLIERNARHLIANATAASLLFAGSSFQTKLLVSQHKACEYAAALATSLAVAEGEPSHSDALHGVADSFSKIAAKIMAILIHSQSASSKHAS